MLDPLPTPPVVTLPMCPAPLPGSVAWSSGDLSGWAFDFRNLYPDPNDPNYTTGTIYCFENPYAVTPDLLEGTMWKAGDGSAWDAFPQGEYPPADGWDAYVARLKSTIEMASVQDDAAPFNSVADLERYIQGVFGSSPYLTRACYICAAYRYFGCFAPGVRITMADGSARKIEDVRAGDRVRNAKTGAAVTARRVIEGPEALPLIRFGFDGATVTTSQAHPVLTAAGLKPANRLRKGDIVIDARGQAHGLTILEMLPVEEGQRVINLELEASSSDPDERLMISDGIVTGDIVLQNRLKETE